MKKIIFVFIFMMIIGCGDKTKDSLKAVQEFQDLCKVKTSSKFVIGSWSSRIEIYCEDIKRFK